MTNLVLATQPFNAAKVMKKFQIAFLLTIVISIFGCKKDDKKSSGSGGNSSSNDNIGGVSFTVDGLNWVAEEFDGIVQNGQIRIEGRRKKSFFQLNFFALTSGTYPISGTSDSVSASYSDGFNPLHTTVISGNGTVIISSYGEDTIRGSFIIQNMLNINGDTVNITNGSFKISRPPVYEMKISPTFIHVNHESKEDISLTINKLKGANEEVFLEIDTKETGVFSSLSTTSGTESFSSVLSLDFTNAEEGVSTIDIKLKGKNDVTYYIAEFRFELTVNEAAFLSGNYDVAQVTTNTTFPNTFTDSIFHKPLESSAFSFTNFMDVRATANGSYTNSSGMDMPPSQFLGPDLSFVEFRNGQINGDGETGTTILLEFEVIDHRDNTAHVLVYRYTKR